MRTILVGVIGATALLAAAGSAEAKGCIKGALVGGVAGHFAGHGKLGAAAGCVIGHHNANKNRQAQPEQTTGQNPQPTQIQNR
jgi:hypothetical protein